MANLIPKFRAFAIDGKLRWLAVVGAAVLLVACDRPGGPPGPIDPARPQTMSGKQSADVQRAVFIYAQPVKKGASAPKPAVRENACCRLQV